MRSDTRSSESLLDALSYYRARDSLGDKMRFDVQSKAPKGYEVIDIKKAVQGDVLLHPVSGEPFTWEVPAVSEIEYIVLKELAWKPSSGEVYFTVFLDSHTGVYWSQRAEWDSGSVDLLRRERGVVFYTRREADKAASKLNRAVSEAYEELQAQSYRRRSGGI